MWSCCSQFALLQVSFFIIIVHVCIVKEVLQVVKNQLLWLSVLKSHLIFLRSLARAAKPAEVRCTKAVTVTMPQCGHTIEVLCGSKENFLVSFEDALCGFHLKNISTRRRDAYFT